VPLPSQHAFIDEFGNSDLGLQKHGVSSHFIVSAIIVDEHKISLLEEKLDVIRKKYFQTGEMKSKTVGNNDARRLRILNDLSELDYHVFAVVVDKAKLFSEGFKYKQSFYKYLHTLVDGALYSTYPNLKISADEYGTKEFMDGFIKYVRSEHIPDLFDQSDFSFVSSNSFLLVQLADFICGTLARRFDFTVSSDYGSEFIKILKRRIIEIRPWPKQWKSYIYSETDKSNYDEIIAEQSANLADIFISNHEYDIDPLIKDQSTCLKFLLFNYRYIHPNRYVTTRELKSHVSYNKPKEISTNYLRSSIIAKLRDSRVLIASSTRGYKLPVCERDLYEFINHSNSIVLPMLDRLEKCRKEILLTTKNGLDIFDKPEYTPLKRYYDYLR